jgi:hypothetical protein
MKKRESNRYFQVHHNNNIELVFDDENIEDVLYNKDRSGPTPANIFLPLKEKMYEIRDLFEKKSIESFSSKVSELLSGTLPISQEIYLEINDLLSELIPAYPKPILKYDIHDFGDIIEKMWKYAQTNNLQERFGTNVYRWYEHYGHYSKARDVLQELIRIAIEKRKRLDEAMYINNLAFEYLLEKEWRKGAPLFKKAAEIFFEEKDRFNYHNARANYLTCEIESNNIEDIEAIEDEVESIKEFLNVIGDYRTRKPYILLAKIEEKKGNINKAISLVEEAISITQNTNTIYPEEDKRYLDDLKKHKQSYDEL